MESTVHVVEVRTAPGDPDALVVLSNGFTINTGRETAVSYHELAGLLRRAYGLRLVEAARSR